jgi:drug/metabolite transporter (DMT)-like permease
MLVGFFFGTSMVTSRFAVGQFHPATFMGLRLTLAGLCHAAVYGLTHYRQWPTDRRLWRHAAVLGLTGTAIPMTAVVTALTYQSAGVTALLLATQPALTVLLAHLFLPDEPLTRRKSLGVVMALGGAALLAASGESGLPDVRQADPIGYGLVLLAIMCFAGSNIYARKYMRNLDAFDVASVRMFVAALLVMPLSVLAGGFDLGAVDRQGYLALGYGALFGTFSAFMLSFYNIKRFGATLAALSSYITPVVATVGGVLVLGETFTGVMLAGIGLIIAGIALINRRAARQPSLV